MQRVDEIVLKLSAVELERVIKLVGRSPRVYPSSTLSPDRCGGSGDTKALRCLSASSVARRQIGLAGAGQDGLAVTVPKNDIASTSVRPQVLSATCTGGTVSNRANIFLRLRRPGCRGNAVQCKRRAWTSGDRLATSYSKAGATADPPREVYVHSDISQPAIQSISPQA